MTKKLFVLLTLPVLLFFLLLAFSQPAFSQTCQITINPLTGLPDCKTGTGGGTAPTSPATNTFTAGATSVTVTHNYGFTATAICFIGTRASFVPFIPGGATTTTTNATTVNFLAAAPADGFCDVYANGGSAGTMVYPGAGVPNSDGSAWLTSYTVGTGANNLVQLNGSSQLPAVSAALLTNFPTLNQNTTGSAATLTTPRSIYGNNFDGSAAISNAAIGVATGTSLDLTGALTAASMSTGSSPPAISGGTSGKQAMGEGTAPTSGCPAAGVDCIYADSTAHALKASYNNDTASQLARYSDALSAFAISPLTTRGDLLTVNSTPALARLAKGTQYQTLQGGATDPGWDAVHLDQATAVTGTLPTTNLSAATNSGGFGAAFDGGGSAIATNATAYMTIPYACTIAASNIMVDTGTLTFKVWRAATGTAIPTAAGVINTTGIGISTGTALRTTSVGDYTDTTLDINDLLAITLTAVSGATKAQIFVECNK